MVSPLPSVTVGSNGLWKAEIRDEDANLGGGKGTLAISYGEPKSLNSTATWIQALRGFRL